mgnify:FL=1
MTKSLLPISRVDWTIFFSTIASLLVVSIPIVSAPEAAGRTINLAYDVITDNLGILYIWYAVALLVFLTYLAVSRYGSIKLGETDSQPEFSTFSWTGMLFCTGVGAGLLYWSVIEWGFYIDSPPFNLTPRSNEAIEWAATYGLFHWGITGWAIYCLPALAIAYPFYVKKVPYLRLSTACSHFLPKGINSKRGRIIDFLFMINRIGGTGTS